MSASSGGTRATSRRWSTREERRYRKGASLMLQGDPLRTVHLFVEGWAKVVLTTAAGHDVLLTILGPADLVGDFEALEGVARSASVVALEPVTTRVVTDEQFLEYLAAHPRAALDLLRTFIHRIRVADRRRIEAGLLDTPHRLGSLLLELAERHGRPTAREPRSPSRVAGGTQQHDRRVAGLGDPGLDRTAFAGGWRRAAVR